MRLKRINGMLHAALDLQVMLRVRHIAFASDVFLQVLKHAFGRRQVLERQRLLLHVSSSSSGMSRTAWRSFTHATMSSTRKPQRNAVPTTEVITRLPHR